MKEGVDRERLDGKHDRKGIDNEKKDFSIFTDTHGPELFAKLFWSKPGQPLIKTISQTCSGRIGYQIIYVCCPSPEHLDKLNGKGKQQTRKGNSAYTILFLVHQREEKAQRDKEKHVQGGVHRPPYHIQKRD